ncbi:CDK-activating kinase assembly factor MAT1 [Olea europaea subsp. europaea]|uniref:CDK-activating kinase assembly factor MAT1 n=1 Tax=Olea europaea subsp. europaea TaxID=158383 RepID=A0A8S0VET2_OLEEU|nr:CDK-activating kinase assembly factor MAT1 [Olea europaea subsp. europaea]
MVAASGINSFAKEIAIRKRIANIYNKREEDFASLREYNDYLEEVEDMIFNLIEGVDVPAIEAKIAEYQRENAEQIMNAHARKAEEYAAALAASKGQPAQTGVDLSSISQEGTGTSAQGQYAPAIAGAVQPRPTGMAPQPIPVGSGHDMLGLEHVDEEKMKLRAEKAAKAGGWSAEICKKRALEEAFASIWI